MGRFQLEFTFIFMEKTVENKGKLILTEFNNILQGLELIPSG